MLCDDNYLHVQSTQMSALISLMNESISITAHVQYITVMKEVH